MYALPHTGTNRLDAIHLAPVDGVGAAALKETLIRGCLNMVVTSPGVVEDNRGVVPLRGRLNLPFNQYHLAGVKPSPHPTFPRKGRGAFRINRRAERERSASQFSPKGERLWKARFARTGHRVGLDQPLPSTAA